MRPFLEADRIQDKDPESNLVLSAESLIQLIATKRAQLDFAWK